MTDAIQRLAEELHEHQGSRGQEFRDLSMDDRETLARYLVISRSQVNASGADWSNSNYRSQLRRKKERYFYYCGRLDIDMNEAETIWWSVVYDDPAPARRAELV